MAGVAHYDVVKHFDFKKLPGTYQVARHRNVGFGRRGVPAMVIIAAHRRSISFNNPPLLIGT